jgi:hypothetical protein
VTIIITKGTSLKLKSVFFFKNKFKNIKMSELRAVDIIDAITSKCIVCGQMFSVCRSCWRGQKCCSKECSRQNYLLNKRAYQKRYAESKKGLENGRIRSRRRYSKSNTSSSIKIFSH